MGKFKDWLKKTKILSNAASLIPFAGSAISDSVRNMGYGKRRRRARLARHRRARPSQFTPDGRYIGGAKLVKFKTKSGKVVSFRAKRKRRGAGLGSLFKKGFNKIKSLVTPENIKKGIEKAKEINNTLKDKKYISNISGKVGNIANAVGFNKIGEIANKISDVSGKYGYGKRRRRRSSSTRRRKRRGGLKFRQNGAGKIRSRGISSVAVNKPVLQGLAKPCGFNHKGIYNPQNDLNSFLAYKLKH